MTMKRIYVTPRTEDVTLIGKRATVRDVTGRVEPDTIICDAITRAPLIVFGRLAPGKYEHVREFLPHIDYGNNERLTQKNNDYAQERSSYINFGFKPKRPVFGHAASSCAFNAARPGWYKKLIGLGLDLEALYNEHGARIYARQRAEVERDVLGQWRIPGTVFTQGIVNNSNSLDYHLDRGNFEGFWSCMAVFAKDVMGGELVIPSLDLALQVGDETYVLFNGQQHVHGVNQITKMGTRAYRYSLVYYSIAAMKNCGTYEEAVQEARAFDASKHRKKAQRDPAEKV